MRCAQSQSLLRAARARAAVAGRVSAVLLAATLALYGCGAAQPSAAGAAPMLLVASGSGSLSAYDVTRGSLIAAPAALPGVVGQLLGVGSGKALVVPALPQRAPLVWLTSAVAGLRGTSGAASDPAPVALALGEPAVDMTAAVAPAATDRAGAQAVVAYRTAADSGDGTRGNGERGVGTLRCRLAWIDVARQRVDRTQTVCTGGELVTALALHEDLSADVAYIALWHNVTRDQDEPAAAAPDLPGGRLLAVDGRTGVVVADVPVAVPVTHLLVMGAGDTLAVAAFGSDAGCRDLPCEDGASQMLAVDPLTLGTVAWHALPFAVSHAIAGGNGGDVFALDGAGVALYRIGASDGAVARLASFPDAGVDLAVADRWLLVASPEGGVVWRVDQQGALPSRAIRTGHFPIALSVG